MRHLTFKIIEALIVVIATFVLGILFPILVSTMLTIMTKATYIDCICSVPFWIFTVLGWVVAGVYINETVTEEP